jgi:hypothetical protein
MPASASATRSDTANARDMIREAFREIVIVVLSV